MMQLHSGDFMLLQTVQKSTFQSIKCMDFSAIILKGRQNNTSIVR